MKAQKEDNVTGLSNEQVSDELFENIWHQIGKPEVCALFPLFYPVTWLEMYEGIKGEKLGVI